MSILKFNPSESVTSRNPIKADPSVNNNVLLHLVRVNVEKTEQKLDTNKAAEMQSEYGGRMVPRIYFEFQQVFLPNSELAREGKERFFVYIENPIVSYKNTNNPGETREPIPEDTLANLYTEQYKHLMHIHKAFEGTPNYIPITKEIVLDPSLSIEQRLEMFEGYFNIIAGSLNGVDGKAAFVDEHGKPILLVSKMIVNKNGRRLEFPTFTGTGFIERAKISSGKVVNTFDIKPNESTSLPKIDASEGRGIPGGMPPTTTSGGLEDLIKNS